MNESQRSYNTGRKIDDIITELEFRINMLELRVSIFEPKLDLMEKYPALQAAYNEYKLIENLIKSQGE